MTGVCRPVASQSEKAARGLQLAPRHPNCIISCHLWGVWHVCHCEKTLESFSDLGLIHSLAGNLEVNMAAHFVEL